MFFVYSLEIKKLKYTHSRIIYLSFYSTIITVLIIIKTIDVCCQQFSDTCYTLIRNVPACKKEHIPLLHTRRFHIRRCWRKWQGMFNAVCYKAAMIRKYIYKNSSVITYIEISDFVLTTYIFYGDYIMERKFL